MTMADKNIASTPALDLLNPDAVFITIFVIIAVFLVIASAGDARRQTIATKHGKDNSRHSGMELLKKTALSTASAVATLVLSRWIVNEGGADTLIEAAKGLLADLISLLDALHERIKP
jgi:hypothetical protein